MALRPKLVGAALGVLGVLAAGCDQTDCDPIAAGCPEKSVAGAGSYWLCPVDGCPDGQSCMQLGQDGRGQCVTSCVDQMYCLDESLECHSLGGNRLCVSATFAANSGYID